MKWLLKLVVALLVIVALVVGGGFFYLDVIAKKAVEDGGKMALGVSTTLDDIHVSLIDGKTSLDGLKIANPAGFSNPTFMEIGEGGAAVSVASILSDTIVIPRFAISNIRVNLEQSGQKNNIEPLLANTRKLTGSSASKPAASAASEDNGSGKKYIVEYFALNDVQVAASLTLLGQTQKVNLVLPKIELKNVGTAEHGLPLDQLIQKVVEAVLAAAQSSSAQLSPELAKLLRGELTDLSGVKAQVVGKARAEVDKVVTDVKQNLKAKVNVELPPETEKLIDEKADGVLKGLDNVLGGKK